jgi:hypothetical protein
MGGHPIILGHDVGFDPHGAESEAFVSVRVRLATNVRMRVDMIYVALEMLGVTATTDVTHGQDPRSWLKHLCSWIGTRDIRPSPIQI